jgi:hypothetical protein
MSDCAPAYIVRRSGSRRDRPHDAWALERVRTLSLEFYPKPQQSYRNAKKSQGTLTRTEEAVKVMMDILQRLQHAEIEACLGTATKLSGNRNLQLPHEQRATVQKPHLAI